MGRWVSVYMDKFTEADLHDAHSAISSMINRGEKAQLKFVVGTSQYTLQKNRIQALRIALSLIERELTLNNAGYIFTKDDLRGAIAPLNSLISKSEKAQTKLTQGTWQHRMLENNLKALHLSLPLITGELGE